MAGDASKHITMAAESTWADYYASDGSHYRYILEEDGESICLMKCVSCRSDMRIPSEIDGLPVTALSHAFACGNPSAETIEIPESIEFIGNRAFERSMQLKKIVFPEGLDFFDNGWLRGCNKLEEIVLPGSVEILRMGIFDVCHPRKLIIGAGTVQLADGFFGNTTLEEIVIDPRNSSLSTDGTCVYTGDGKTLLACATTAPRIVLSDECLCIGRKAFAYNRSVFELVCSKNLMQIEEFAFSNSVLARFDAPASLRTIGRSAFYRCENLKHLSLNEGLLEFGYEAFRSSGITELHIPSTLERWGYKAFEDTGIAKTYSPGCLTIAPENLHFALDTRGLLYDVSSCSDAGSGAVLIEAINQGLRDCTVADGTVEIGPQAFMRCHSLSYVKMPEGLTVIGDEAFRGCRMLQKVHYPSTLTCIGDRAFYEAGITNLYLPACFQRLGVCAFITHVEPSINARPTIADIQIAPECTKYFVRDGLLYERKDDGKLQVLQYLGPQTVITLEEDVNEIAPYAFHKISTIRELEMYDNALKINPHGFATATQIDRLTLHLKQPFMGKMCLRYEFPELISNVHMINFPLKFGITSPSILQGYYDGILTMIKDPYDRARLIVDRLCDSIPLNATRRKDFMKIIERNLANTCVLFGEHTNLAGFEHLADLGLLNVETIERVIEDPRLTANLESLSYLLAMKEKRFNIEVRDYSL